MTQLIQSSDVYKETELKLNDGSTYHCKPTKKNIGSLPTLFSREGVFLHEPNTYLFYLKATKKAKDLNPCSRALLKYYQFIEDNNFEWDRFPSLKRLKPTYQFRAHLLTLIKREELAPSTANTYINHVKNFYLWAVHDGYLKIHREQEAPFKMEFVQIQNKGILAHFQPTFTVSTSDLRIKVPKDSQSKNVRPLSPLSRESLSSLTAHLPKASKELRLQVLLAIDTGMRIEEVSTFSLDALDSAVPLAESNHRYELLLSPKMTGVQTKYGKERHIEISLELLESLNQYRVSERRLHRANKLYPKLEQLNDYHVSRKQETIDQLERCERHEPLFVSQQGNPVKAQTINARWAELRAVVQRSDTFAKHRFHDLRATYCTYRLSDLLDAQLPPSECLDQLMGWMGHKDLSTTWKYLRYLKRKEVFKVKFGILDTIMNEALGAGDE
ncbi:tyrosine-type recombinase/integrase [Shewanella surugensis]|uniref:Site-specific integrase n=1 Tax=Shewanella surugensis TaxID=212020 RepID=A0ABT0LJR7_9GAMM|nr:tyrosine-type recombinase/integrase [Shewanella surugensis]MCL1127615.1 site-specific integrase [Shewanella surugensis]